MEIRWGRILAVVLAIVVLWHWRTIRAAIQEMDLAGLWSAFCDTLRDMPAGAKYILVLGVLALAFVSLYRLLVLRSTRER